MAGQIALKVTEVPSLGESPGAADLLEGVLVPTRDDDLEREAWQRLENRSVAPRSGVLAIVAQPDIEVRNQMMGARAAVVELKTAPPQLAQRLLA
jgi:hypothetical protein